MADNIKSREVGELTVKVNTDVSEAITGFKALQREIRETTKALREYEAASNEVYPHKCRTCGGKGFVGIGEGIRGVKKCVVCRGVGGYIG